MSGRYLTGLTSMTGFGRAEISLGPSGKATVEVHTLNHRYLDVDCRLPEGYASLEESIRVLVRSKVRRGKVKVSLNWKSLTPKSGGVKIKTEVAQEYVVQLNRLKKTLGLTGSITLETLLTLPNVVALPEREGVLPEALWPKLKAGVEQALGQLGRMRSQEGKRLMNALRILVRELGQTAAKIRRKAPLVEAQLRRKWAQRVEALSQETGSPAVVAPETATWANGADVSEELQRIGSHLMALEGAIQGKMDSPGRTLDFLCQELSREINTVGSKLRDAQVAHWVVDMKNTVEKLREQAANVE